MEFISINKNLCNGCKKCLQVCPNNAIDFFDGFPTVNNKKCTVCGSCYKNCPNSSIKLNIPIEKIRTALNNKESIDLLKTVNEKIISDNKNLAELIKIEKYKFELLLSKLNEAVIVIDRAGKIINTNEHFLELLDTELYQHSLQDGAIIGAELRPLLSDEFYRQIISSQNEGKELLWITTQIGTTTVSASIIPVHRGEYTIIIFRDVTHCGVINGDVRHQLEKVIDHNLAMVQKIGFLVGEEMSMASSLLRKVIKSTTLTDESAEQDKQ